MKRQYTFRALGIAAALLIGSTFVSAQEIDPWFSRPDKMEGTGFDFMKPSEAKDRNIHSHELFSDDGITEFEIGMTKGVNVTSPIGIGTAFGSDFRIPIVSGSFRPMLNGFRLAADIAVGKSTGRLSSDEQQFAIAGGNLLVVPASSSVEVRKSIVRNCVLSSSLLAGLSIGKDIEIFGGVEGDINLQGSVINKVRIDGDRAKDKLGKIDMRTFTYAYKVGFAINDIGLYFKYSPLDAVDSVTSPNWQRCSFGIIFR